MLGWTRGPLRDRFDPPDALSAPETRLGLQPARARWRFLGLPVQPTRFTAGLDNPLLNATVERFAQAVAGKGEITRLRHPSGQHAFDILDDDATSAEVIEATLAYLTNRLLPR